MDSSNDNREMALTDNGKRANLGKTDRELPNILYSLIAKVPLADDSGCPFPY